MVSRKARGDAQAFFASRRRSLDQTGSEAVKPFGSGGQRLTGFQIGCGESCANQNIPRSAVGRGSTRARILHLQFAVLKHPSECIQMVRVAVQSHVARVPQPGARVVCSSLPAIQSGEPGLIHRRGVWESCTDQT